MDGLLGVGFKFIKFAEGFIGVIGRRLGLGLKDCLTRLRFRFRFLPVLVWFVVVLLVVMWGLFFLFILGLLSTNDTFLVVDEALLVEFALVLLQFVLLLFLQ